MLDYEWGNPSAIMLAGEEPEQTHLHHHGSDPTRQGFLDHHYGSSSMPHAAFNDGSINNNLNHHFLANPNNHHHHHHHNSNHHIHHNLSTTSSSTPAFASHHLFSATLPPAQQSHHPLFDTRAYGGVPGYAPASMLAVEGEPGQFMMIPKSEEAVDLTRLGLNLGGRTYFSSSEDDFMSRLYRRARPMDSSSAAAAAAAAANSPRCQAEGCNADLSHAKHYHRRHKVCEFHSKASTVIAAGLTQRFCQQCSRFHLLSEFDNGKRSCRKRLADHNRRRRKTQQQPTQDNNNNTKSSSSQPEISRTNNPSSDVSRSPPDSGVQSSSSVTVAVSPPRMSLDCFRQRSTYQTTVSSGSSNSLFF